MFSFTQKLCSRTAPFPPSPPIPHYLSPSTTTPPARLPKGAGLRQALHLSNTSILCDTHNAPILQTISAARLRDRRPIISTSTNIAKSALSPTLHHPKFKSALKAQPQLFIIHNSLFIIHYSLFITSTPYVPPMYHFYTTCYFHSRKLFSSHILLLYQP